MDVLDQNAVSFSSPENGFWLWLAGQDFALEPRHSAKVSLTETDCKQSVLERPHIMEKPSKAFGLRQLFAYFFVMGPFKPIELTVCHGTISVRHFLTNPPQLPFFTSKKGPVRNGKASLINGLGVL
jgi:hypothetical protein